MKKTQLLNSHLSLLVASLGHTDEITIGDAGLPIPENVQRIDLALTHGVPGFIQTVETLLSESQIEGVIIAEEMKEASPELHQQLLSVIETESVQSGQSISVEYLSHEAFKARTKSGRAVIRTGECTPYANVIFKIGVVF